MNRFARCFAILVLVTAVDRARAENTIGLDSGYPKTGSSSGAILVKGSITVDMGWSIAGNVVTVSAWRDGLEVTRKNMSTSGSGTVTFGEDYIDGLESDATYNIIVEVTLEFVGTSQSLITQPATAKAK